MALFVEPLVKIAISIAGLMTAAAYLVLLERWIAAWVQDRLGPNRVGPFGLLQPLADGVKFILKEEYTPAHVERFLYTLAPISILGAALAIFATIPFGHVLPPIAGIEGPIRLIVAPGIDVGMIYIFALSSIAVYGVILGGWASNNKYSFLGGLRASAQLVSYELPMSLGILGVVLFAGSLRLENVIDQQASSGVWNVFLQPLGFLTFVVAAFAESARLPFDLPECEQELIGGYHTEYSGVRLLMYLVAEFLHMITAAFLIVILFLGGWHLWGVTGAGDEATWPQALLRVAVLMAKVLGVIVFFMMARWSWPRFRFDQLMTLAWKAMLPLGLVNLTAVACVVEFFPVEKAKDAGQWAIGVSAAMWAIGAVAWTISALLAPLHSNNRPRAVAP